jgi:hypothetical protein
VQRIHDPLHGIFEIRIGLRVSRRVGVWLGEVRDQDVDMPDLADDLVGHFGICHVPGLSKHFGVLLAQQRHDIRTVIFGRVGEIARLPKGLPATMRSFQIDLTRAKSAGQPLGSA